MSLEAQLTIATKAYQKLQTGTAQLSARVLSSPSHLVLPTDYAGAVEGRQRLDAQLSENESVMKVRSSGPLGAACPAPPVRASTNSHPSLLSFALHAPQEFAQLTPENKVYKLLGPVLLLQEQDEAKVNVSKRLEFIRSEM
jgi:hypothetical protein